MEFRDLKAQYQKLKKDIDEAVLGVMERAQFISGPEVKQLEAELAEYVDVKHCITCANGTDAMELVLLAWGIGEGDAVFVPTFSFMSTAEVVAYLGARPIFVDIDGDTYNIDPAKLEQDIEQTIKEGKYKPKAIIPVDLFGLPADYDRIVPIAHKYGLKVLEDGAQGFGGSINDKRACSFGDAATTSFFPAKPLGCYGDGGAIFTADDELAAIIRSLAVHGKGQEKYDNVRIGRNSRLDTMQAAVLLIKLKAFKEYELDAVNRMAVDYTERLKNHVSTPIVPDGFYSSWAQYTMRLESQELRDNLQEKLKEVGIPSMVYYPRPLHLQAAFSYCGHQEGDFPEAEEASRCVLSLPVHAYPQSQETHKVMKCVIDGVHQ